MNRIKFLVFALVALGLFGWSLKLAPSLGANRSTADASLALAGAPPAVALRLESRRSELQAAMLKLAASPALTNPGPKTAKPEVPTAERFNAVRTAALEGLSDTLKGSVTIVVANEAGALAGKADGDPAAPVEGLDVAAITAAGGAGSMVTISGVPHLFYALPLLVSDKNEVKSAGTAAIGAPLIGDGRVFLAGLAKEHSLTNISILSGGKIVALDGDKVTAEAAIKSVKAGPVAALTEAPVTTIGPISLPMMSALTQQLALRRPIAGTPYEVLAIVSSVEDLVALAGFQQFGLGALGGLLLLAIAVLALLKSGEEEGAAMVMPPPMMPVAPLRVPTATGIAAPVTMEPAEAPPEASPDDFHFPPAPSTSSPKTVTAAEPVYVPPPSSSTEPEPMSDPFATLGPTPSKPPPPVTASVPVFQPPPSSSPSSPPPPSSSPSRTAPVSNPFDDEEGARTMAYPIFKTPGANPNAPPPGFDPFAMAASQSPDMGQMNESNPDATRVAAVPAELLRAAKQTGSSGNTGERPALAGAKTQAAPKVTSVIGAAAPLEEERHFQDVFREFVATREKCGEPADGLTYDKFKAKLLKNKEQLVAKYNCKSVRFQVYVKDAKAALKATPVKD